MAPAHFTLLDSALGGALIGLAAVAMMGATGRIAGISGIALRLLPPYEGGGFAGRLAFLLGIVFAPALAELVTRVGPARQVEAGLPVLFIAGLFVGFGAIWGNGCTSGHGVCGLSRLSKRSFLAVGVFVATAAVTVLVTRHTV